MPRATSADYDLNTADLAVTLKQLISADTPAMVWGPPGLGKSAVATQVAAEMGMQYIDIRALLLDPVDLRGIPYRDAGRTRWAPPDFLPDELSTDNFLLNLEELPTAPPMVQAALYQLVFQPRQLGEYHLPKGARIIACGNRETDRGAVTRMLAPLASRFIHIDVKPDTDAWVEWALANDIAMEVIFFLKFRPDLGMKFDPKSAEKAFPCYRTWEFVSNVVKAGNKGMSNVEQAILRGAVGEGAAIEFAAFLQIFRDLPLPESVFADPTGVKVPTDPSAVIALCAALARKADQHLMDAIVSFAKRDDLRSELGQFLVDACLKANPDCAYTKANTVWQSHVSKM